MAAIGRFGTRVVPEIDQIIKDCRARKQLVQGPYIEAFEQEFARVLGAGHVRTCSTEFGRMPFFQKGAQGRDHNPDGFTCWLTGAGVKRPASLLGPPTW